MVAAAALASGQCDEIAPGVRRLVAHNPGLMTGPGTNTYLVGTERFVVIDPGPIEDRHVERILAETDGRIDAVLVTHTHGDHSPAAQPIAARTQCALLGRPPPGDGRQDLTFAPTRILDDGAIARAGDLSLLAHLIKLADDGRVNREGSEGKAVE